MLLVLTSTLPVSGACRKLSDINEAVKSAYTSTEITPTVDSYNWNIGAVSSTLTFPTRNILTR